MWAILLKWLLNPKNLIIIGLSLALVGVGFAYRWEQIGKANLQNKVDGLRMNVDHLTSQIAVRDAIIKDQEGNIAAIKTSLQEMTMIKTKTRIIRKTIKELVYVPTGKACETSDQLGEDYGKVAGSIAEYFNTGVRGEGVSPRHDSETPSEVLPKPNETGVEYKSDDGSATPK